MGTIRAVLVAAVLAVSGAASVFANPVRVANACSCPECDVVVDAPIIVSGRFESWHESADIPAPGFFTTIIARLQLEAVYKGAASAIVQVVDVASLSKSPPGWYGASADAGTSTRTRQAGSSSSDLNPTDRIALSCGATGSGSCTSATHLKVNGTNGRWCASRPWASPRPRQPATDHQDRAHRRRRVPVWCC